MLCLQSLVLSEDPGITVGAGLTRRATSTVSEDMLHNDTKLRL